MVAAVVAAGLVVSCTMVSSGGGGGGCVQGGPCEGGALPVTMSFNGVRESHDYRDCNVWVA